MVVETDIEILELAVSREIEAYHFFMAMAERLARDSVRKIFEELAQEELEHKSTIEFEMMKLGHTVPVEQELPGPKTHYVMSNIESKLDVDYKDILLLGIEKENASFRTYVDLIGQVSNQESREMLLNLAEQEVRHKLRFQIELEKLQEQDHSSS